MLAITLLAFAITWSLWLTYMLRYPARWADRVDAIHAHLERYGLSIGWMKQLEKGIFLKALVGATVVIVLASLIENLRHPDALSEFFLAARVHYEAN